MMRATDGFGKAARSNHRAESPDAFQSGRDPAIKVSGERLGRGFEVSETAGDRGAGTKLELRK